jgi:hypothetical protein
VLENASHAKQAQASKQAPSVFRGRLACFARESFDSAVAPLEARAGRPLRGPWRGKFQDAFDKSPEGFCRVRDDVLERSWVRAVFAYTNRLLDCGDHLAPVPQAPPSPPAVNPTTGCTHGECRGLEVCVYP